VTPCDFGQGRAQPLLVGFERCEVRVTEIDCERDAAGDRRARIELDVEPPDRQPPNSSSSRACD
jgi:hypothetical protein